MGAVLLLLILVVNVPALQGFFTTISLTWDQWLVAAAVGSSVLWVEELRKAAVRRRQRAGIKG